jgi:Tfp pilus assembly protein PilO
MKLFLPILFVVIAITLFFWYIDPTYKSVQALVKEQGELDHALTRSRELQDVRDELTARRNTFPQSDVDKLQKLLPDHVDNVRLILDLDSMAARYNMRVRDVTIAGNTSRAEAGVLGTDEKLYESVVLSFSVTGTYDTFRQFLSDLERSLRLVDVVGISFTSTETGIYDFDIDMQTYWLKP